MHIQHENKVHNTFIYKKNIQKIVRKRTTGATYKKLWGRRQPVQRATNCGEEDNRCNVQQIVGKETTGATANDYKWKSIES